MKRSGDPAGVRDGRGSAAVLAGGAVNARCGARRLPLQFSRPPVSSNRHVCGPVSLEEALARRHSRRDRWGSPRLATFCLARGPAALAGESSSLPGRSEESSWFVSPCSTTCRLRSTSGVNASASASNSRRCDRRPGSTPPRPARSLPPRRHPLRSVAAGRLSEPSSPRAAADPAPPRAPPPRPRARPILRLSGSCASLARLGRIRIA